MGEIYDVENESLSPVQAYSKERNSFFFFCLDTVEF